jgi:DNA-directed RNA polymerase subunit P
MALHKCFECDREIKAEYIKKKIRCPYCGSKILYKPKVVSTTFKAK